MSWKNRIDNTKFSIKTGDGKEFFPLWKSGEKSLEFNTSSFDFIDVEKSLIERKKPKSSKYPLTFWFQGDDNVDKAEAFERSAKDNRYWTVTHPFYGTIKGQPLSITRNNNELNITEITVDFWETIIFDFPKSNLSIQDNTLVKKEKVFSVSAEVFSAKDVFEAKDINALKGKIGKIAKGLEGLQNDLTFPDFQNKISKALKASDALINNSLDAISFTQDLLNLPGEIVSSVKDRIGAYVSVFNSIVGVLDSVPNKLFFQTMGASVISTMCNESVKFDFETDYLTVTEVEETVSKLLEVIEVYNRLMDDSYVSNTGSSIPFSPSYDVQFAIQDIVNLTVASLYETAFDAQQERIVYLDKDSNLILLTHKYMGLASDENIIRFRELNGIKLRELFKVKKGRKIKYYV